MANRKYQCRLTADKIPITDKIYIRIPTVGKVLEHEQIYYSLTYNLTSSPYQQMVRLDDMGIDYSEISEWELFMQTMYSYSIFITQMKLKIKELSDSFDELEETEQVKCAKEIQSLSGDLEEMLEGFKLVFGDLQIEGFQIIKDPQLDEIMLYNPYTDTRIDRITHLELTKAIRELNLYEHVKSKPANENAKKYLLEQERKKQKRIARKPYEPYLEKLIISLVNTSEFPYNYETCMDLSLYKFNQSFKQIQHKINFDNTMVGVYAGTVSTKDMKDKSVLSWIQTK